MTEPTYFAYIKLMGSKLSPRYFNGKEPGIDEVYRVVSISKQAMVPVKLIDGVHWLSENTYNFARKVLGVSTTYEAHEGVTFTGAKGAWLIIGEPKPVEPPIGAPKNEKYVVIETELSKKLGLEPFITEEKFVFRGFKGEDVEVSRVTMYRYFIAAYERNGNPLTENELKKTLLWKNYLCKNEVTKVLGGISEFLKKKLWYLERMSGYAMKQYKVVWRDVAKEFIPAIEVNGAVPDYTVNYIVVKNLEEAYYLLAILLAPQINAVVSELSPWIGHVQPRFIEYFKIPAYNPENSVHRQLVQIGDIIHNKKIIQENLEKIKELVEKL